MPRVVSLGLLYETQVASDAPRQADQKCDRRAPDSLVRTRLLGRDATRLRGEGDAGRAQVFVVLYRIAGAGSRLRKYTIGPYGRVTLHVARNEAQRVLVARTEGRDPAAEKREARRRLVTDRVDDLVDAFIKQHVSKRRSAGEISRILKREIVGRWGARSVHDVTRRDIIELVSEIVDRGAPVAANKNPADGKELLHLVRRQGDHRSFAL